VLIVEDSDDDAILLIRMLNKGGYKVSYLRVDNLDDTRAALTEETWDVIISDYSLPSFNGLAALRLLHELEVDLPFIIVSGTIGEDLAVEAMRAGAHDYLMKDSLARLVPAIQRELQESRMRHERKQRERELAAIATIATSLRVASNHDTILATLHDQLVDIVAADGIALDVRDTDTGVITTEFASGDWQSTQGVRLQPGEGITNQVVESREIYVHDNVLTDPNLANADLVGDLRAVVCVPLIAEEHGIGAIWVGRRHAFSEEEVRLLTAISDIAASALYRARILETLEQRVQERTSKLESMNERLQDLDRLKSKFVSDVSHELRTPVTNLGMYLDLLERGDPEKREKYFQILKQQVERLSNLVESTLALSRLESDLAETVFESVNLNPIIFEVVTAHLPRADSAGLTLIFEEGETLPTVLGDPEKLNQVATNLVANALNYTEKGSIRVSTYVSKEGGDQFVCLSVEDTGIGIHPEDMEHLFDRFYRGRDVSQSTKPGTGLGLSIVKEIVEQHQGTIEIGSELGHGTSFTISLPIAR
jgi:signal transduction histidine kinase/CheY-like chemotaxis protein